MKLTINLRRDLKKLNDVELAHRLESAWVSLPEDKRDLTGGGLFFGLRAPVRHPRAYRLTETIFPSSTGSDWLDVLIPLVWITTNVKTHHQLVCEIRDMMDEVERRVALRKRSATA